MTGPARDPAPRAAGASRAAPGGVRFRDGSLLVSRALEALASGPRPATELARAVFGLRRAPEALTRRLLAELLGADARVTKNGEGVWRLVPESSREAADRSLRTIPYVVVDVETTSGSPDRGGRILEIAAVRVEGGRVVGEFSTLVDPGVPVPPWISRLTGITDAMVADAPPFEEVADRVRREVEGRVFTAHNAPYDWRFLSREMGRARSLLPTGPRLCTLRLARRALPGLERRGLDALARYLDIPVEPRHRAGGDARATARVLLRLLEAAERRGVERWSDLEAWLDGKEPGGSRPEC